MNKPIVLAAALVLSLPAMAMAKTRHHHVVRNAAPTQIACTMNGCAPVRPECGQRPGRSWSGNPTGMDVVVCPPGVQPFP